MSEVRLTVDEQDRVHPLAREERKVAGIDRRAGDRARERGQREPPDPAGNDHRCWSMYLAIGESSRRSSMNRIAVFGMRTCGSGACSSSPRLMSWLVGATSGSCDVLVCT